MTAKEKRLFIEKIGAYAVANYPTERVLPSVIIAQAILESGWGESSELAKNYNNYFGLKWYNDSVCKGYNSVQYGTWEEYIPGEITNIDALFCAFDSLEQCFECLYKWYNRPKYADLHGEKSYIKTCSILYEKGYATDSKYPVKLCAIIRDNNLDEFDKKVLLSVPKWFVQLSSFKLKDFALRYYDRCVENGLSVRIKLAQVDGGGWYRIQTDGFETRNDANKYRLILDKKGYKSAYVTDEGGKDITDELRKEVKK